MLACSITWEDSYEFIVKFQVVIAGESKKLRSIFKRNEAASLRTNHMLVLNLAVSDFLMGIYLIILGISGAVFSGFYCLKSLQWMTSSTCTALGILVILSSETSVMTMVLLTGSRLFAVFFVSSKDDCKFYAVVYYVVWVILNIGVCQCIVTLN